MPAMMAQGTYRAPLPSGEWVADVRIRTTVEPHPDDPRKPYNQRPLTETASQWAQILGITREQVKLTRLEQTLTGPELYGDACATETWRVTSPVPFVVVYRTDHDRTRGWEMSDYYRGFDAARQTHYGELGRHPELRKKPAVMASNRKDPSHPDRTLNWVRLVELANITGISAVDIVRGYSRFSPSSIYEPNVPVLWRPHYQWSTSNPGVWRVYTTPELPGDFCLAETAWSEQAITLTEFQPALTESVDQLWVPQTFANRVMRLVQCGLQPDGSVRGDSFTLTAPEPPVPVQPLPSVPLEDLKELRMDLQHELTRGEFTQAAQRALGRRAYEWRFAPELEDPEGGAGKHYFAAHKLTALDGRVVVSVYSWTRAGATRSDNHYAGMVAVFPKAVDDARRDPSALLRIWFWPDSLLRCVPTGYRDGLCPPQVPDDAAMYVQRLLGQLGYNE